jgi:hypothetical protein
MMHDREKSDPAIVARKPANNAGQPAAERVERRAGTGGRGFSLPLHPQVPQAKRIPRSSPRRAPWRCRRRYNRASARWQ